jgi:ribonuclease HI
MLMNESLIPAFEVECATMVQKQERPTSEKEQRYRVFVDATIEERHAVPKRTFVAYVVEGRPELQKVAEIENAHQTDEAELEAVAFAIRELKNKLEEFTILSDNEGVVSEILRGETRPSSRPILAQILSEIKASRSSINVELFSNLADRLLKQYLELRTQHENETVATGV